jgi:hemolysin activation/secretion protein
MVMAFMNRAPKPHRARSWLTGAAVLVLGSALSLSCHAQSAADSFDITRFVVEGNSVLSAQAIDAALAPLSGKGRDFSHVQQALEALDNAYRERGYNAVQLSVPEQSLSQGVIRLRVVEMRVGSLRIVGNAFFDEANIRRSLPGLRLGMTPNIHEVAASLKLANENPAKRTSVQFRESAGADGSSSIDALIRISGGKVSKLELSLDNAGGNTAGNTGSARAGLAYQHANIGGLDHVGKVQVITTPQPGRAALYSAAYHIPLYQRGDSMDVFASHSDHGRGPVAVGAFELQARGSGTVLAARYNQHLRQIGDLESRLIYSIDHRAYRNDAPIPGVPTDQRITVQPVSLTYAGRWLLDHGQISFHLGMAHNLSGGGRGGAGDLGRARAGAQASYTLLRYGARFRLDLPADWQLNLAATAQHTRHSLVWAEQFTLGGTRSVRGFGEADIAGDKGHALQAELQTPELCAGRLPQAAPCRLVGFYDAGRVAGNGALPGQDTRSAIASAGLGLRLAMGQDVSLHIDYARVIDGGGGSANGEQRVHASFVLTY